MKWRLSTAKICPVIAGGFYIHPTEDRLFGHKELAYLAGFPHDYKWEGPVGSIGLSSTCSAYGCTIVVD